MSESTEQPVVETAATAGAAEAPKGPSQEARKWAMLCHLTSLSVYLGIPFGHVLVPLVLWYLKKDSDPYINEQGKEALLFQISMSIYSLVAGALCFILIGIPMIVALIIMDVVLVIVASTKVHAGENYKYPFVLRILAF